MITCEMLYKIFVTLEHMTLFLFCCGYSHTPEKGFRAKGTFLDVLLKSGLIYS